MREIIKRNLVLILIAILAIVLCIGNPWYDFGAYRTVGDEFENYSDALRILRERKVYFSQTYPPLWTIIQIPFLALTRYFMFLGGEYTSLNDLDNFIILNLGYLLPVVRILSAFITGLSIVWIYKIGKVLLSKQMGLLSALFWAISYIRVQMGHFARPVNIFMFFSLGTLYYLISFDKTKKESTFYNALWMLTLAIVSYGAGYFLVPLLVLVIWSFKGKSEMLIKKRFWLHFVLSISLIIINYVISHNANFLLSMFNFHFLIRAPLYYLKATLKYELFISLAAIIGYIYMFKDKVKSIGILILFASLYMGGYFFKNTMEPRYVYLLIPILIIGAVYFLLRINDKNKTVARLIFSAIVIVNMIFSIRFNQLLFIDTTYKITRNWIKSNTDQEDYILVDYPNINLIPNVETLHPVVDYYPDYFFDERKALEMGYSSDYVYKVRYMYHLQQYISVEESKKHVLSKKYRYIIFSNNSTKSYPNYKLYKVIDPSLKYDKVGTELTMLPYNLFFIDRFGFEYDIYKLEI